jgi:hypothetical protein
MYDQDDFNKIFGVCPTCKQKKSKCQCELDEDVVGMNPQATKPYFSPEEAQRANNEWVNQAQVDQEDGVIVKGTDGKQYRIMTSYGNQHFEDGEVFLQGLTDPNYIDTDGYPDAAELLYYHSPTGHYVEENFADGKKKGKSRPGRVKRSGASCNGSVTDLRKRAKNSSGEKAKMYHWCANMKSGKKKANESTIADLDRDAIMAKKQIDSKIASGDITNIEEIKQEIMKLRFSGIIYHPEDARALWQHYLERNSQI